MGVLCRACALAVWPHEDLIAEHIRSKLNASDAVACLVDGFGRVHPVACTTRIGRDRDCGLTVLDSSVSREHAEIQRSETGWSVRDLTSRNGTFVGRTRVQDCAELRDCALLKVGNVALWFLADLAHGSAEPTAITVVRPSRLVRYVLLCDGVELCIMVGDDRASGGALLYRPIGAPRWLERGLAPLEFQLLRALCIRNSVEENSRLSVRGCVATKQLVSALPFLTKYANQENVRQVVLRLRGALSEVGAGRILAIVPRRGYYLACKVHAIPIARAPERGADVVAGGELG